MGKRVLLVEGDDDQHVMWNLFEKSSLPENIFTVEQPGSDRANISDSTQGGIENLLKSLSGWLLRSDLECLAVIVDADDQGVESRWQSIRNRLRNLGHSAIPDKFDGSGAQFEISLMPSSPRSIRFAVWIMPDNHSTGMLEDFVLQLVDVNDLMLKQVDGFLNAIPLADRRFSPSHSSKARVHSWLAVSQRPGRPMGQAIAVDKHINIKHPSVTTFLDWVRKSLVD